MYLFVIGSLFSLKPQSTILYLEICVCVKQWVVLYVLIDGQGIFTNHSCDLASLLCDWLSFQ